MQIPKIIFQTWKTKTVPDHWRSSPISIQRHHPQWKYILTTDEDNLRIVKTYFPQYLHRYLSFEHPIQRADMIRPMLLYLYGGIYLDLDFEVLKPLDPLFESGGDLFIVPSGNTPMVATNSFMASRKGHPFWLEYLRDIFDPLPGWAFGKHLQVMLSTGPLRLSMSLRKTKHVISYLPQKLVIPCSVCSILSCKGEYLRSLQGQSWNSLDSHIFNWVMCNTNDIALILIVILIAWKVVH